MVLTSANAAADHGPAWMNQDWAYRMPVTIDNSQGGALSSYQVRVVVPYDTDMKSDYSDLRFTDSDGVTPLPYWIENVGPPASPPASPPSYRDLMDNTSAWLFVGQDAYGPFFGGYGGGVSYGYSGGWSSSDYMEVTGYIIPTILNLYHHGYGDTVYRDRALSMADWEVYAQSGGDGSAIGYVYDTGMMVQGLLAAHREVPGDTAYLAAAEWGAQWICAPARQAEDGSFINCNDIAHDYHARVDWILLDLYKETGNTLYRDVALNNLAWIYDRQDHTTGWYASETNFHFISYAVEGMLESGVVLKTISGYESLGDTYVASAKLAADALLSQQNSDGSMTSGSYSIAWVPGGPSNHMSADGQIAEVWARLYQIYPAAATYLEHAQKTISYIASIQDRASSDPNLRGSIAEFPGSSSKIPWAAKFFLDALINTPDPGSIPPTPPTPPVSEAIVWIRLPNIPAGQMTIYAYYGNPTAESASDGNEVFDFFDDFSGDLSKWTVVGGSWTIQNGELVADTNDFAQRLRANDYLFTDGIIDGRIMYVAGAWFEHGYAVRGQVDDGTQFYSCHITKNVGPLLRIWKLDKVGGTSHQIAASSSAPLTLSKWYDLELSAHGDTFEASALPDYPRITGTDPGGWSSGTFSLLSWSNRAELIHYDNIRIRQYASVEPTTVLGAEEAVDVTPPTTVATLAGTSGLDDWYRSAVTVTLSATDSGSGVAATYYGIDAPPSGTYTEPLVVSGEGLHSVQFYSVDNAGNAESTESVSFNIDTTPPVVTISSPVNGAYYQTPSVPGGVFSVVELNPYTIVQSGWFITEGVQTYTVTATDDAGNSGSASVSYTVDNTAPVVTISSPVNGAYYQTAPPSSYSVVEVNLDTVVESGYSTVEGTHTYMVAATDLAGNIGTASVTYTVDNTPPVASFTASMEWTTVSVDASASYDSYGLALTYAWDFGDGEHAIGAAAVHTYAANGTYTVALTVTNSLGLTDTETRDVTASARTVFNLILKPGWNLVSLPLVDYGYRASMLGLNPGDTVSQWNPLTKVYQNYIVGFPGNDFTILAGTGYWINVPSGTRTLALYGSVPTATQSQTITVPAGGGWAIIGFTGFNMTRHASDIPAMYSGGSISIVATWSPVRKSYTNWISLFPASSNFLLVPGQAYWILCTADGVLTYEPVTHPVAKLTVAVDSLDVTVDGSGSFCDGSIVSYEWTFGDGAVAFGVTAPHTYAAKGTYTITLTVKDSYGLTATTSVAVAVKQGASSPLLLAHSLNPDRIVRLCD